MNFDLIRSVDGSFTFLILKKFLSLILQCAEVNNFVSLKKECSHLRLKLNRFLLKML